MYRGLKKKIKEKSEQIRSNVIENRSFSKISMIAEQNANHRISFNECLIFLNHKESNLRYLRHTNIPFQLRTFYKVKEKFSKASRFTGLRKRTRYRRRIHPSVPQGVIEDARTRKEIPRLPSPHGAVAFELCITFGKEAKV